MRVELPVADTSHNCSSILTSPVRAITAKAFDRSSSRCSDAIRSWSMVPRGFRHYMQSVHLEMCLFKSELQEMDFTQRCSHPRTSLSVRWGVQGGFSSKHSDGQGLVLKLRNRFRPLQARLSCFITTVALRVSDVPKPQTLRIEVPAMFVLQINTV